MIILKVIIICTYILENSYVDLQILVDAINHSMSDFEYWCYHCQKEYRTYSKKVNRYVGGNIVRVFSGFKDDNDQATFHSK